MIILQGHVVYLVAIHMVEKKKKKRVHDKMNDKDGDENDLSWYAQRETVWGWTALWRTREM